MSQTNVALLPVICQPLRAFYTRAADFQKTKMSCGPFFVEDAEAVDVGHLGPILENNSLFPERTNVQFAHVVGKNLLRTRVWERGVGVTLASGSSSCATAVAAVRLGLTGRKVEIQLDGGMIYVDWRDDGVWMTGATLHVFDGMLTTQFLESLR